MLGLRQRWTWQARSRVLSVALGAALLWFGLPCSVQAGTDSEVQRLAAEIDRLLAAHWPAGLKPAPLTEDAELVRRIYLDLVGRIPPLFEARDFLDDDAPDKRPQLVDTLLAKPDFARHFTNVWRALLLPNRGDEDARFPRTDFEEWLLDCFQQNAGYDRMVRELLTGTSSRNKTPVAFFQLNRNQPEALASNAARLFLGIRLECAQCHNHPHAQWTRQQFWELAAFFAAGPQANVPPKIQIPGLDRTVSARFPNGDAPQWQKNVDPRTTLANWVTSPANPYFARTAVNRLWGYFFGIGLVEPVDEAGPENPPSHPELLDRLAQEFVAHHCDLKFMIRAITSTQAYQRTSKAPAGSTLEPRLFARMAVRGLTPEQLFDSLVVATNYQEERQAPNRNRFNNEEARTPREEFLARFTLQEKRTEMQTSILQALHLMNSRFMADVTRYRQNEVVDTIAEAARSTTAKKIEELYLTTLGRKPRPEESARLVQYVDRGGAAKDSKKALADVFWALLNSSEFMLNH
jgi:hypothetical protein